MMGKSIFKMLAVTMAMATACSLGACGGNGSSESGNNQIVTSENTLNVRIRKAGYGTDYIYALAEQFEKTFASEGYKVNILAPREDLVSTNVYRDIYSKSGIDVYFTSDIDAEAAVTGDYGQVFSDLTESVWNQKPIKFDGTEEILTVEQKMEGVTFPDGVYNSKIYGLPYVYGFGGLVVNKKALDSYNLELPRTTNELFACAETIMEHALDTGVFPFTYSLSGNNYPSSVTNTWIAQYDGKEKFDEYYSFVNSDGSNMENDCYKVFAYDGVVEALESLYHTFDYNMAAYGSGSQDFTTAQGQIMKGTAVFYSCGNWFINEEYERYNRFVNDVTFINAPVVSALGTKLFGADSVYKLDDAKCESVLTTIIKYVDQQKTVAEIESLTESECAVSLETKDVETVCQRRGYINGRVNAGMVIAENSPKKDLAATFLRFCCSTEAGALFAEKSRGISPYAMDANANDNIPFVNSVNDIASNPYKTQLVAEASAYRKAMGITGLFPYMGEIFATKIYEAQLTKYDDKTLKAVKDNSIYRTAAEKMSQDMYKDAKTKVETGVWKVIQK